MFLPLGLDVPLSLTTYTLGGLYSSHYDFDISGGPYQSLFLLP